MRFPSDSNFFIGTGTLLAAALFFTASASPAWAQRVQAQTAKPSAVKTRLPAPPPVRVPPNPPPVAPIKPITTAPVQPSRGVGSPMPPIRYARPPVRTVQPITGLPASPRMANPRPRGVPSVIYGRPLPDFLRPRRPSGTVRPQGPRLPAPTRRLLLSAPSVTKPPITKPAIERVHSYLPRFSGIAELPQDAKTYCSPDSILYNTGSICFNPDAETINPEFYPWGLFAPPPQLTPHGFISLFPVGLLIQPCPQCSLAAAGLIPSRSPLDRWWYLTSGAARLPLASRFGLVAEPAESAPPHAPVATAAQPSGPDVVLVLRSGTRLLVSRYWLGQDWMLHFITVTGSRRAVGLNQLNLQATGAANYDRGVTFVLPGWPEPQPNR